MSGPAAKKERGIPFTDAMVQAILADDKTVTRRIVRKEMRPLPGHSWRSCDCRDIDPSDTPCVVCFARFGECPYGRPGDRLWVREAWRTEKDHDGAPPREIPEGAPTRYEADGAVLDEDGGRSLVWGRYRHARFMPRWAGRLDVDVVSVRVERLHDITDGDAILEGCSWRALPPGMPGTRTPPRDCYAELWDAINGAGSFALDPWVWRIEFRISP